MRPLSGLQHGGEKDMVVQMGTALPKWIVAGKRVQLANGYDLFVTMPPIKGLGTYAPRPPKKATCH